MTETLCKLKIEKGQYISNAGFSSTVISLNSTVKVLPRFRIHSSFVQQVFFWGLKWLRQSALGLQASVQIIFQCLQEVHQSKGHRTWRTCEGVGAWPWVVLWLGPTICALVSPWRTSSAFATGFIVFAYSGRNANLTGVNLFREEAKKNK